MSDFPARGPHVGRFVTLEPMDAARDATKLYAISHESDQSKAIFTYLQRGPYENEERMRDFLLAWCADPAVVAFTVHDNASSALVGTVSLMNIRAEHGVLEIGNVWYAPTSQRTKTNTESAFLLLKHAFDGLGYRRIEWKCDVRNRPSGQAALRLGFTYEGIFRKHMIIRNANRDSAWYSMIDDEWPARREALSRWLYIDDTTPLSEVHPNRLPY